ncbi:MAG TPA: serine/threonine-protein kinase [Actinophytocola sp.]|nr:serine/threonine-protein kinase [Actinophytocola sp.]
MEPGDLIAGRYRLLSLIGRGAMGIVWRARDERLDRPVAVKQLLLEAQSGERAEEAARRAMREGRIAGRLRHPNAISVHDVVTHDDRPCLIMEYLKSASLAEVVAARGVLPPGEVAEIGRQVAAALVEAHAVGIVHRDIKPDNVLITEDGTAKITDFGISRATGDGTVTAAGILAGTPAFLAPEVAGGADADFRSDVFSLGATLYAALEGRPPFGLDDNPIALLHRVAAGEIVPPRRAGPVTTAVLWLLRRDPGDRPTMRGAHDALTAAAAGQTPPVVQPRPPTLLLAQPRTVSRRTVVTGAAAMGLVAVGVVLGSLLADQESTGAPGPADTTTNTTTNPTTTTTPPAPGCVASFEITTSWSAGYQAEVTISNDGDRDLTGWLLRWTMPADHEVNNLWNGEVVQDGTAVTVTNADYNVTVPAGEITVVGMTVDAPEGVRTAPEVTCESQ